MPAFVKISNRLQELIKEGKATSKQLALKAALHTYVESDHASSSTALVDALAVPGVESTPLSDESEALMDAAYAKAVLEAAKWTPEEEKDSVKCKTIADFIPKLLQSVSCMHKMLRTRGSFSTRTTLEEIISPSMQLKSRLAKIKEPVKYVEASAAEALIPEMLHLQSLYGHSKSVRSERVSEQTEAKTEDTVLEVLEVLEPLDEEAKNEELRKKSLSDFAGALQKKAVTAAEVHVREGRKLVGENTNTKVWAQLFEKEKQASFEEAVEGTLLKPSYVSSVKSSVEKCQEDL